MSTSSTVRNVVLIGKALFSNVINVLLEAEKAIREHQEFGNYKKCLELLQENKENGKNAAIIAPPEKRANEFEKALKINQIPYVPFKANHAEQSVFIVPNEYIEKAQVIYDQLEAKNKSTLIPSNEINADKKMEITLKNDPALLYIFDNVAALNNLSYSRTLSDTTAKISVDTKDANALQKALYSTMLFDSSIAKHSFEKEAINENNTFNQMKEAYSLKQDFYIVSLSSADNYAFVSNEKCQIVKDGVTKELDLSQLDKPIEELYSAIQEELTFDSCTFIDDKNIGNKEEIINNINKSFQIEEKNFDTLSAQNDIIQVLNEKDKLPFNQDNLLSFVQGDISLSELLQIDETHYLYENIEKIDSNPSLKSASAEFLSEASNKINDFETTNDISFGREESVIGNEETFISADDIGLN